MDSDQLMTALLGPLITAVLAVAGVWLREWWQRRDDDHRRRRTLSDAREQVGFINAWLEAHDRLAPKSVEEGVLARAESDLEQAYAAVARSLSAAAPDEREPVRFRTMARSLFLLHALRSGWAKLARVIYYFGLVWAALWTAVGAGVIVEEAFTPINLFASVFLIVVLGVAPAWALRSLVLWLEKRLAS